MMVFTDASMPRALKLLKRAHRSARYASKVLWGLAHRYHPVLAHLVAVRRCNLSCAYCNEYDSTSQPVPLADLRRRVDLLAALGTSAVTVSGGEPLLHPEIDAVVAHVRRRGMVATLITNAYLLSEELIGRLNRAGLDHLEISVDNVEPDTASSKSLRLLEPKLRRLALAAEFGVSLNSVVGAGVRHPEDALSVARRAKELGFQSSVGIVHDGSGQLRPLAEGEMAAYRELRRTGSSLLVRFNGLFQDNLARGRPNDWRCRAGSRYLYVDENGRVHYCSQQRGFPDLPLEGYTRAHLRHEYDTRKPCAPFCTVTCVQQVAVLDNWRSPQRAAGFVSWSPRERPTLETERLLSRRDGFTQAKRAR